MEINVKLANVGQETFFNFRGRNQCFSGGFNNGKTFVVCLKIIILLLMFPGYRVIIARQTFKQLKETTMATFFALLPKELVLHHNAQDGHTILINGSTILWMHLDKADENSLRGVEANLIYVDQGEEMEEKVYDVLDARVGRWSHAKVPENLLEQFPDWPRNALTNKPEVPSYMILSCNPDTQFHFIYRKYHPDSDERLEDHEFIEGEWDPNLGSRETYLKSLNKDPEWVSKYMRGKWGTSSAQIHIIQPESILEYSKELLELILTKGNLFRVMDHGETAPTCCLWFAAFQGIHICYREYYMPERPISYHRTAITELSFNEEYSQDWADPSIFKAHAKRSQGEWTVADEYSTDDLDAPPLYWSPADNNEFATRNRINELLKPGKHTHPITKDVNSPGIYFIKASREYPYGCKESIRQLTIQKKLSLGTVDGKTIYCDDRDEKVVDHAYDPIRYYVAMHGTGPDLFKTVRPNTFAYYKAILHKARTRVRV